MAVLQFACGLVVSGHLGAHRGVEDFIADNHAYTADQGRIHSHGRVELASKFLFQRLDEVGQLGTGQVKGAKLAGALWDAGGVANVAKALRKAYRKK